MTAPAKAAPMREDVTITADDVEMAARFYCSRAFGGSLATERDRINLTNSSGEQVEDLSYLFACHRLSHTARPDAGDEDVERVASGYDEPAYLTRLRQYAYPLPDDDVVVAALKKAARQLEKMHADKAWISNDVDETIVGIKAALAAMRVGVDRGMVERLEAERAFLLDRADFAGEMRFGGPRCTGMSSNAIVAVAFGQTDPGDMPYDSSDLAACYRALKLLPCHLLTGPVADRLTSAEAFVEDRYPGSVAEAQSAAEWPGFAAPEQPR